MKVIKNKRGEVTVGSAERASVVEMLGSYYMVLRKDDNMVTLLNLVDARACEVPAGTPCVVMNATLVVE